MSTPNERSVFAGVHAALADYVDFESVVTKLGPIDPRKLLRVSGHFPSDDAQHLDNSVVLVALSQDDGALAYKLNVSARVSTGDFIELKNVSACEPVSSSYEVTLRFLLDAHAAVKSFRYYDA